MSSHSCCLMLQRIYNTRRYSLFSVLPQNAWCDHVPGDYPVYCTNNLILSFSPLLVFPRNRPILTFISLLELSQKRERRRDFLFAFLSLNFRYAVVPLEEPLWLCTSLFSFSPALAVPSNPTPFN
uniref:Uncharacterized protein n=1 Tax=Trypanosoma congolense (strain IL3000) TaxID=1068625 RepID=G0US19_TRYCI|nr:hypothetical protein, unlikely [Trypanosoma congolense IL3000]